MNKFKVGDVVWFSFDQMTMLGIICDIPYINSGLGYYIDYLEVSIKEKQPYTAVRSGKMYAVQEKDIELFTNKEEITMPQYAIQALTLKTIQNYLSSLPEFTGVLVNVDNFEIFALDQSFVVNSEEDLVSVLEALHFLDQHTVK